MVDQNNCVKILTQLQSLEQDKIHSGTLNVSDADALSIAEQRLASV